MKINNSTPPSLYQVGGKEGPGAARQGTQAGAAPQAGASSSVDLSRLLADSSQDIDSLRVSEVREAIIEGRLEIDTGRIADGLLDNLKGL
ncbi:flagellar biosynthesis anti-sigma factor FlgM [Mangrovimicrobium sediminis]|uniref:flagellar biosynthesis anti-sigma factor FlgM n=1 Tax=Mangrovimicrobium sediminis TaxID=2562682 RepID=UPI00197DA774|nr:flagellar biosynthesis anti-sigma factor FlgM [Haliea sp. SAOS-164]